MPNAFDENVARPFNPGSARPMQKTSLDQLDDGVFYIRIRGVDPAHRITTESIRDEAVTFPKAAVFVSSEQTGTGSSQNVAHGLGVTPSAVLVAVTEHPGTPDTGAFDVAEGTHDETNVVVTVTTDVKFKVLAWA